MKRRYFISLLFSPLVINKVPPRPVGLDMFFDIGLLNGIPYHESNSGIGQWCGIERSSEFCDSFQKHRKELGV